jgi:phosphatidylinositol alpha-1,6-mannosyltransferase
MENSQLKILLGLTGLNIDGGIAVVSRCVARILDECIEAGDVDRVDRVLFLDEIESAPEPSSHGDQALALGSKLRFVWQVYSKIWSQRPDLVFFDLAGLARCMKLPLPGLLSQRYVIFAHGIELDGAENDSRGRAIRGAWRILTNSEFTADRLRSQFSEIEDRIFATPLCIDPALVELWESRTEGLAKPDGPIALIVGRTWADERGKGHDQLLDIWQEVERRVPGATLWVVGAGDDLSRLKQKAEELGISSRVHFWGRISDEELCDLYQRAAVFAMPSRQEGFGLVYVEAMWHGLPCIGSDADAAREVISAGQTGLLVPYDDRPALCEAMIRILAEPDYRNQLGEAATLRAREYFCYERFKKDVLSALGIVNEI